MTITIVSAQADTDFAAVRQIYYETWQVAYRGLMPQRFLDQLTPASWHPEKDWQNFLLALDASRTIIGICKFGPARLSDYATWGELAALYVTPGHQRAGIGQRLMTTALDRLNADQHPVYLRVLTANDAAQRFYTRFGFHDSGRRLTDQTSWGALTESIWVRIPESNQLKPLTMSLAHDQFQLVAAGTKTIEIRLNDAKRQQIQPGDTLVFNDITTHAQLTVRVRQLEHFSSLTPLFKRFGGAMVGSRPTDSVQTMVADMAAFYTSAQVQRYGVLAIRIQVQGSN